MKYIYAAFLLRKLRKELNEENVKKVVAAAGI
ncbi:MAG TPA: 50S ribosomal protein P1, partial [Candidatus Scalindua sp.]|nr:50S ribosomal protein P1 [Candidatus Scalindua sp.]